MNDTLSTPTTDSDTDARDLTLVSWNVNGLRAVLKKEPSFAEIFNSCSADVFAIQETNTGALTPYQCRGERQAR